MVAKTAWRAVTKTQQKNYISILAFASLKLLLLVRRSSRVD